MKDFVEQFLRIFFRRFIVRNIGYYVLRILFALFNNQKGITWLLSTNSNEGAYCKYRWINGFGIHHFPGSIFCFFREMKYIIMKCGYYIYS